MPGGNQVSLWQAGQVLTYLTNHFLALLSDPSHLNHDITKVNRLEKEKQDYLFCLEAASKFKPREGVLLVEDDSLPGFHLSYIPQSIEHLDCILLAWYLDKEFYLSCQKWSKIDWMHNSLRKK